jgi:hypothetical protein
MDVAAHLAGLRLVAQRLIGEGWHDPVSAVTHLGAVQGQDLPGALTSVALRTASRDLAEVLTAFDTGLLVRSWPMRGTLHLVPAVDLGWMLSLTATRMVSGAGRRRAEVGISPAVHDQAQDLALVALDARDRLTRKELFGIWRDAGLLAHPQTAVHLLGLLCQETVLVLGPLAGREQLIVGYADWIPQPRRLEPTEALAELARRYLRSHGPATEADLARWSSLSLTEVRIGIAAVRDEFALTTADGTDYLYDPDLPQAYQQLRDQVRGIVLLPGFDEYILGYRDRGFAIADQHANLLVPGNNGMFRASVVKDGQVIGTWKRGGTPKAPRLLVESFTPLSSDDEGAVQQAFAALPTPR